MYVPALTNFATSIFIAVVIPIVIIIVLKVRYGAYLRSAFVGSASFMLFALLLEQLLHQVLMPYVRDTAWLYVVYGCLTAGIFEECGRYLTMRYIISGNNRQGLSTALMYGAGHGGMEVLILGISMLSSLLVMISIASSGAEEAVRLLTQGLEGETLESAKKSILDLAVQMDNSPASLFLAGGVERIAALLAHISLSVIVYPAATEGKTWMLFAAVGLHAAFNIPAALGQIGLIGNIWIVEAIIVALSIALAVTAMTLWKRFGTGPLRKRGSDGQFARRLSERRR